MLLCFGDDVIAMRKNKFFFFIFGSLCAWAIVTYFLFLHRPQGSRAVQKKENNGADQIVRLETELRQQFEANEEFLARLRQLIQLQHNTINTLIKHTPSASIQVPDYFLSVVTNSTTKTQDIPAPNTTTQSQVFTHAAVVTNNITSQVKDKIVTTYTNRTTTTAQVTVTDKIIVTNATTNTSNTAVTGNQNNSVETNTTHIEDQIVVTNTTAQFKVTDKIVVSNGTTLKQEVASEQRAEQGAAEEQRIQEEEVEQNLADADQRIQDLEAQGAGQNVEPVIAVLVFSCNRVTVTRCLDQLIKFRPSKQQFPIVVTQDCAHQATADAIASYGDLLTHIRQPDQNDVIVPPKEKKFKGYFKIARHYGWALNETFFRLNYDTVIIVEDDLDVAPDFFEYFLGTYALLRQDRSLFCVSAWNDNGKSGLVDDAASDLLYRTDFFPGLGWMLTREIWSELSPKWPKSYWDDWVRQPEQRKHRACIRPELSRTRTFGKIGVSNGLFYEKHLKFIKLNEKFVPFTKKNLTYLLKDNYDVQFVREVYDSPVVTYQELKSGSLTVTGPVRIQYHTRDIFKRTAKMLGLMDDFKSGVPRTGYRGVISFSFKGRRVYLAPNANWKGYDPSWS